MYGFFLNGTSNISHRTVVLVYPLNQNNSPGFHYGKISYRKQCLMYI